MYLVLINCVLYWNQILLTSLINNEIILTSVIWTPNLGLPIFGTRYKIVPRAVMITGNCAMQQQSSPKAMVTLFPVCSLYSQYKY